MERKNTFSTDNARPTVSGPNRSLCRALGALALGELRGEDPRKIVASAWPTDSVAAVYTRATISPTSTSSSGASDLLGHALSVLTISPQAGASKLLSRAVQLDFSGIDRIGVVNPTTIPSPAFTAQGSAFPIAQAAFDTSVVGPIRKFG